MREVTRGSEESNSSFFHNSTSYQICRALYKGDLLDYESANRVAGDKPLKGFVGHQFTMRSFIRSITLKVQLEILLLLAMALWT